MTGAERLRRYFETDRIADLYKRTQSAFAEKDLIAHNWDHIYRDIINALIIGEEEGADMRIVVPATILHDIGFLYDPDPALHHKIGAQKCEEWLADWNRTDRKRIARCILVHKGKMREFTLEPENLEEQVVCDADMLEKVGWIGVLQAVRTFVEFAQGGKHEYKRLTNLAATIAETKAVTFYTETGRRMAEGRGGFLRAEVCEKALRELEMYRLA